MIFKLMDEYQQNYSGRKIWSLVKCNLLGILLLMDGDHFCDDSIEERFTLDNQMGI